MSTQVRITLQDKLYRRAKRLAEMTDRNVEDLLAQAGNDISNVVRTVRTSSVARLVGARPS